jgi:hypothetical protein
VPVMVVGRCDVRPSAACKSPEQAEERNDFREGTAGLSRQEVP